jgi:phosphohistidine phosphatase
MLVGHNPGFTGIVGFLTEDFIENMPTSGAALLKLNILSWKQVSRNCGTIEWFDFPKKSDI